MKNIIWRQPSGAIGVYSLSDDADSRAVAAQLLASGQVDSSWVAVLFDAQAFPEGPQEAWRCVGGALVFDPAAIPPPSKIQRIAAILAAQGEGKDRTTLQLAIQLAELTATVQAPSYGMTPAQAIAYAYSKNATYKRSKDAEAAIRVVETGP